MANASAQNFRRRVTSELALLGVVDLTPLVVPSFSGHTAAGYRSGQGMLEIALTTAGGLITFGSIEERAYVDATEVFFVAGLVDMETQDGYVHESLYPDGTWRPGGFEPVLAYLCRYRKLDELVRIVGDLPLEVGRSRAIAFRDWKRRTRATP